MSQLQISSTSPIISNIIVNPLQQHLFKSSLSALKTIISSSMGPNGKLKCIRNSVQGHVIITSSSNRILSSFTPSCPLIKLLWDTAKNHIYCYNDNGLLVLLLAIHFIETPLRTALNVQIHSTILEYLINECSTYLESPNCMCKFPLNFENTDGMLSVVKTVLSTKNGTCFSENELSNLTLLVLKAFLETIPNPSESNSVGRTVIVTKEGYPVSHSQLFLGLLWSPPNNELCCQVAQLQNVKLALVTMSLNGDLDVNCDKIQVWNGIPIQKCLLQHYQNFIDLLFKHDVRILVSQKIIHPSLKLYLQSKQIIVIDRLGKDFADHFMWLSDAKPIESLVCKLNSDIFGHLKAVECITSYNTKYLLFKGKKDSFSSLLLCNLNEEVLSETKVTVQQALDTLYTLLQKPWILSGGGCTEVHLATYIFQKVQPKLLELSLEMMCHQSDFLAVLQWFVTCLQKTAESLYSNTGSTMLVDNEYGHLWGSDGGAVESKCKCRQLSKSDLQKQLSCFRTMSFLNEPLKHIPNVIFKDMILDCFIARLNAYKTAASVSAVVLQIGLCIIDKN